jgi:cytochrome c peroxidase
VGFTLSDSEVEDVVAFLNSLTDEEFLHNPAFSDPHGPKP